MEQDRYEIFNSMFRNAILTSKKIQISTEERMKIAFDSDFEAKDLSVTSFLIKFANYGAMKMIEVCSDHDLQTADKLIDMISEYSENNYKDLMNEFNTEIDY